MRESKKAELLGKFVEKYQLFIDSREGELPPKVKEAMNIILQVNRLVAGELTSDAKIRDVIFSKMPREKIEEALAIVKEWESENNQDEENDEDDDEEEEVE